VADGPAEDACRCAVAADDVEREKEKLRTLPGE
jgi:hypothetical protein